LRKQIQIEKELKMTNNKNCKLQEVGELTSKDHVATVASNAGLDSSLAEANGVPNGPAEAEINKFVVRFDVWKNKTAEALIELGKVVYDAKNELDAQGLSQFCKRVGLDVESSTFRKMYQVGHKAIRFTPLLAKLPPNWTTLYGLATFEDEQFQRAAEVLEPTSTFKALKEAAGMETTSKSANIFEITLTFQQEPTQNDYYKALEYINDAKKQLSAEVRQNARSKNLDKHFKTIDVEVEKQAA
jgi:hypothetical protein